jgi:hypothetical protein
MKLPPDLTGQRFGELTALYPAGDEESRHGGTMWMCRCSCGVRKKVRGDRLTGKSVTTCGNSRNHRRKKRPAGSL